MPSDLIFPILPRQGKVPIEGEKEKVQEVSKEAKLRRLNDQEKELHAEEREAREKYQKGQKESPEEQQDETKRAEQAKSSPDEKEQEIVLDDEGKPIKHLDIYI